MELAILVALVVVVAVVPGGLSAVEDLVPFPISFSIDWRSADPSNFAAGRRGVEVDTIVLHTAEGSAQSAINWFAMNHGSDPLGPSSAHYVIDLDGNITQMVDAGDTAWHAGNNDVNRRSIGIEVGGYAGQASTWTAPVMDALARLIAHLREQFPAIPLVRGSTPGILGHADVAQRTASKHWDPGPYLPWDDLMARLGGEGQGVA